MASMLFLLPLLGCFVSANYTELVASYAPVLYYPMTESQGATQWAEYSDPANSLDIFGTPAYTATPTTSGKENMTDTIQPSVPTFDGSSVYGKTSGFIAAAAPANTFSVGIWYFASLASTNTILSYTNPTGWVLGTQSTGNIRFIIGNSGSTASGGVVSTTSQWIHFLVTFQQSTSTAGSFTFYVNGLQKSVQTLPFVPPTTGSFRVGAGTSSNTASTASSFFTGFISHVAVWNIKLTSADAAVLGLYAPTPQPTLLPTSRPTRVPTREPTAVPTSLPTSEPTAVPTGVPTSEPTYEPTVVPTYQPTSVPTSEPTYEPTVVPTYQPTSVPTSEPTYEPTVIPTYQPTHVPTREPTAEPTIDPTFEPTTAPATQRSSTLRISGASWGIVLSNSSATIEVRTMLESAIQSNLGATWVNITNMYEGSLVVEYTYSTQHTDNHTADEQHDTLFNDASALVAGAISVYNAINPDAHDARLVAYGPYTLTDEPACGDGCVAGIVIGSLLALTCVALFIHSRRKTYHAPAPYGETIDKV